MCCDTLVCANCSRPVAEASCSVCQAARASFHSRQPLPIAWLAAVLALLVLLALVRSAAGV